MKIEKVPINRLISPNYNPRQISDEEMNKLKRSIEEFGYVEPIIVNKHNMHIIGGNQRFKVLKQLSKELNIENIDVIFIEETDPNREKALNIALNKIQGEFDFSKLGEIFNQMAIDGFDISTTGFEDFEINMLVEHFDDDFEDIGNNNSFNDNDFFIPAKMKEERGTFDLVKGDVFKFPDVELKVNSDFVKSRTVITIYQEYMHIKFESYDYEKLLENFLDINNDLKDRFRSASKQKE